MTLIWRGTVDGEDGLTMACKFGLLIIRRHGFAKNDFMLQIKALYFDQKQAFEVYRHLLPNSDIETAKLRLLMKYSDLLQKEVGEVTDLYL